MGTEENDKLILHIAEAEIQPSVESMILTIRGRQDGDLATLYGVKTKKKYRASIEDLGKKVFGFTLMGFITPEELLAQIR